MINNSSNSSVLAEAHKKIVNFLQLYGRDFIKLTLNWKHNFIPCPKNTLNWKKEKINK